MTSSERIFIQVKQVIAFVKFKSWWKTIDYSEGRTRMYKVKELKSISQMVIPCHFNFEKNIIYCNSQTCKWFYKMFSFLWYLSQ